MIIKNVDKYKEHSAKLRQNKKSIFTIMKKDKNHQRKGVSMEYELYIDVLFLINFMMDYLILSLVHYILKFNTKAYRILLGSILGAFSMCSMVLIGLNNSILILLVYHMIISTLMVVISFGLKNIVDIVKSCIILYVSSVLMGGLLSIFSKYLTTVSIFFTLVILSYYTVKGIWIYLKYLSQDTIRKYEVEITIGTHTFVGRGILDTGNLLKEPITLNPVHIINSTLISTQNISIDKDSLRYIPYNSIGGSGVLQAIKAHKMYIKGEKNICVYEPIIALSKENISSKNGYDIILNPNIF